MEVNNLFKEQLIYVTQEFEKKEELLESFGHLLFFEGFVESSFATALIEREREFPTGLALNGVNISIPHTDPLHVKQPFICVVKSEQSIPFIQMGSNNQQIDVHYLFILGITQPEAQVQLLEKLMDRFMDVDFVHRLHLSENKEMLFHTMKNEFKEMV